LSNKQLATDSARFGVKTYAALTSYGGALTQAKQTPAELWRTMAQLGNKPNTPLIRCFSTNVQGLSMDGIFFSSLWSCSKRKRDAKNCKIKIKQDYNTPIASWSSALHFAAFCSYLFSRNGMAELFAGSTAVEQTLPCFRAMLNITVTGTIYGCDELPCFVLAFKMLTKKKVRIQNGSLSNQNAHLSGWIHSLLYGKTRRSSIRGNVQTVQFRHGHHIQIFC
jgi:hypothetical protein